MGSTLGLQRSAKIIKRAPAKKVADIAPATSLLGLQRNVRLQRTSSEKRKAGLQVSTQVPNATVAASNQTSDADSKSELAKHSILGLQRATKLTKVVVTE